MHTSPHTLSLAEDVGIVGLMLFSSISPTPVPTRGFELNGKAHGQSSAKAFVLAAVPVCIFLLQVGSRKPVRQEG